jgi:hypothetical protein
LQTGIPQKLADMRLRNEPKNLRSCDLRTNKLNKICVSTFDNVAYRHMDPPTTLDVFDIKEWANIRFLLEGTQCGGSLELIG